MEAIILFGFFWTGAILGSFYNVLGVRIPNNESIIAPRSHCDKCNHTLKWYELIPILSFIIQKGKCRNCGVNLSYLYPFSEIFCGPLFALSYYSFGFSWNLIIALAVSSLLIVVTVSDLNYMIIPNRFIVIPSIIILLVKLFAFGYLEFFYSILNGLFAFLMMFFIMKFGSYVFKKEALGGADVKLMFVVGICLHPFLSLVVIVIASIIALPISLLLLYKSKENIIPFGPFIVIGLLIVLFTKYSALDVVRLLLRK